MNSEQNEQARNLYIRSGLSKTDIAATLGLSRRAIYQWCVEGAWDDLLASAAIMPSMLAERCYHLIGNFTERLLLKDPSEEPVTTAEANTLCKLVNAVSKLKKGSTISEDMETFTSFLSGLDKKDPALAQAVAPHVTDFIACKKTGGETQLLMAGFKEQAAQQDPAQRLHEAILDQQDAATILKEKMEAAGTVPSQAKPHSSSGQYTPSSTPSAPAKPTDPRALFWQSRDKIKMRKEAERAGKRNDRC